MLKLQKPSDSDVTKPDALKRIVFKITAVAVVSLSLIATNSHAYEIPKDNGNPSISSSAASELSKLSEGLADLAEHTKKALVYISISKTVKQPQGYVDPFEFFFGPNNRNRNVPEKRQGLGSGFFIDSKKGYIITNNHVVEGADEIELKLSNGKNYPAKIVGRDENTDIAVLEITDKKFSRQGLGELILSDREPKVGEFSVALGAPFGLEASISFGVLSAMGRNNLQITKLGNFIQTDAAINPGNSGGPLIDMQGKVIGVNTAIYSKSGGYNGIGFAVPAKLARNIASKLINDGKVNRGYIGVGLQELTDEIAEGLGLKADQKGALVKQIEGDGPAKQAGLTPGDIITHVDSTEIESNGDLILAVGTKSPGDSAKLKIIRNGKQKSLTLKIGAWPGEQLTASSSKAEDKGDKSYGLTVSRITNEYREIYGFESNKGVVITNITPNSPADVNGLRNGDVVLTVNSKKVESAEAFEKEVAKGKRALLRIERRGDYLFVALTKDN